MYRITYNEQGKQKYWKQVYPTERDAQRAVIQLRNINVHAWYYSITARLKRAQQRLDHAKEAHRRIASQQLQTVIQNDIVDDIVVRQNGAKAVKLDAEQVGQIKAY